MIFNLQPSPPPMDCKYIRKLNNHIHSYAIQSVKYISWEEIVVNLTSLSKKYTTKLKLAHNNSPHSRGQKQLMFRKKFGMVV
jgi:hypothetical protein